MHWHSSDHGAQPLVLGCQDQQRTLMVARRGPALTVTLGDERFEVLLHQVEARSVQASINGRRQRWSILRQGADLWLADRGLCLRFVNRTHAAVAAQEGPGSGQLKAPMDGAVLAVRCQPGQTVRRGEVLVVMEAMKMEHSLKAPADGVVASVGVKAGDQVKGKQILLTVEH
ncbi:MAG: hypothetical protein LPK06_01885 [Marinobacter sp.]|nr:hypothetical protein [Marinobacter sp.]